MGVFHTRTHMLCLHLWCEVGITSVSVTAAAAVVAGAGAAAGTAVAATVSQHHSVDFPAEEVKNSQSDEHFI